jgi:peptidoglycan hydrolase-like protein with peptidoglycan-binding domain
LQSDLAWVGQYNGAITGDVSTRMVEAIKEYQKNKGGKPTGVLNPQERATLAETARRKQDSVGWKIVTETTSGARLGIPGKLVPNQATDANGSKWTSPTGTVQVLLNRRKEPNPTTAKLAEREKKEPAGRQVDYTVVKPDFFVLSGLQGLKKFYVRGTFKGDEVRIMTILYDQATENTVEPVVIAMSSAFNAFPSGPQAGPATRKTVEYGTGIVVSDDGAIVTDRLVTDSCLAITVAGYGSADRLAEDKEHDLALLHIYGARGLKPLGLTSGGPKTSVDVVGIADPQSQGGAAGVSNIKGTLAPVTPSDTALSPPPPVGFSGGAAIDAEGKFAGVALLKPAMVAGPATSVPASQAVMVSADTVREFLKANAVTANGTSTDAKAAVVRVICVRK